MKVAYREGIFAEQPRQQHICTDAELAGNENVFNALKKGIESILFYDTKTKTNVMNDYGFPKSYLIKGEPGCGKTTAIKAAIKYGKELSSKIGRIFFVTNIGNKFKSEYYSKSAQELRKIFNLFFSGSQINIGIIEDIDTVFSKRNRFITAEDSANLGEIFNLLEGVETINYGNYIIIGTTNNSLEPALEQRMSEFVLEARGPEKTEHYEKIIRTNLRALEKFVEPGLGDVAEILLKKRFSGRDAKNLCRTIAQEINCHDIAPEAYALGHQKQRELIGKSLQIVTKGRITEIIEEYEANNKIYK